MKTSLKVLLGAALIFSAATFASDSAISQIESAYQIRDGITLQSLQTEAKTYEQALAHYRLATLYYFTQKKEEIGIETLKASSEILEELLRNEPNNPEVLALLSGVYGMQIQMQPMRFMSLGYKSTKLIKKAAKIAPQSPRVQFFLGVNKLNAPSMFGGSEQEALAAFTQAVEFFDAGKSGSYNWGQLDALIWRGITLKKMGNAEAAKQSWKKALELAPDSRYAKRLLKQA